MPVMVTHFWLASWNWPGNASGSGIADSQRYCKEKDGL
jgi:hypothetical protein